ncbi:hypothetical protein NP233_g600 [Leucocoprinus birnbaumii]|uniref:Phosphatase n=1 Tax=Leucocoprinus birnbaumii TaxID=56174 RepID=A0AAD5YVM6_9AGAR|nr:hypothetical protein NP233_g600 [Leucocoprinus birnbaumii]
MSEVVFTVDAILFDMDGTLVDSTAGVVGAWETFKESYPDIDVSEILSCEHWLSLYLVAKLPTSSATKSSIAWIGSSRFKREAQRFEEAIVTSSTKNGRRGIVMLPGTEEIINEIKPYLTLPSPKWAICTSATRIYATAALKSAKIPQPDVLVVAEDVKQGKPYPDPYLLGASQCGVDPSKCVVFEDAPSGVRSGRAAGCKTIGLLTSHSREQMEAAEPDILVKDLSKVSVKVKETGDLEITVSAD